MNSLRSAFLEHTVLDLSCKLQQPASGAGAAIREGSGTTTAEIPVIAVDRSPECALAKHW